MNKLISCFCFLALAGCAQPPKEAKMYDGPVQTGREVILQADAQGRGRNLIITKVDGTAPVGGVEGFLDPGARTIYLLPGTHTVEAKFSEGTGYAYSRNLSFVGEAGKSYFVRAEPATSNFLVGTTSVRFWIQDGSGRRVGASDDSNPAPGAVASAPAASAALPPRPSGCRQLSFTDGSSACMEDFEPLAVKIGTPGGLSVLDRATAARTFAYAVSEFGPGCQATYYMAWNNPTGNDERARQGCDAAVKKDTRNMEECRCALIVSTEGKVPMTQKEFVAKMFALQYRLLDSFRASKKFEPQWGEIAQLKRNLQLSEKTHDQRLAGTPR